MRAPRPGVVTFVGVVLYLKTLVALVLGLVVLFERNNAGLQSTTGQTADELLITALTEFIVAMLLFIVASAVMSGAKWSRLLVAVVTGIRLAVATWWMVTHLGGGFQWNALITAGIGVWVLWALYGNEDSQEFFEGYA